MSEPVDLAVLARSSGRYPVEAFEFVSHGLRHAVTRLKQNETSTERRHLDAAELVGGVLDLAVEHFGLLAQPVLAAMQLRSPEDVGRITFILIDHDIFSRQPSDRFEDFLVLPAFSDEFPPRIQQRLAGLTL